MCRGEGPRPSPAGPGSCGEPWGHRRARPCPRGHLRAQHWDTALPSPAPGRTAQPRSALPRHLGGWDGHPSALPTPPPSLPRRSPALCVCPAVQQGRARPGQAGAAHPALLWLPRVQLPLTQHLGPGPSCQWPQGHRKPPPGHLHEA